MLQNGVVLRYVYSCGCHDFLLKIIPLTVTLRFNFGLAASLMEALKYVYILHM